MAFARIGFRHALAIPLLLTFFTTTRLPAGQSLDRVAAETNVNQQYVIESVSISGVQLDGAENAKLPGALRERLNSLVGARCDMNVLNEVSDQLRRELHLRAVSQRLLRGSQPGRIRVNFEIERRPASFDVAVPKFLYHSEQKFSGEVDAIIRASHNTLTVGATSNGDDLTERFTGAAIRYDNSQIGTDRVRFGVEFDEFHEQWRPSTVAAAGTDGDFSLYHARRNIAPQLTFVVAKPFTISVGTSFEQMESGTPRGPDQSANALTADLRYNRGFEGSLFQQQVGASYSLRTGFRGLGSDYAYSRHMVTVRYEVRSGRQLARDEFMGGMIAGDAPMFERFVLGSSETLRGWDRYVIDPLGGTRVVHNSITYGYQIHQGTAEVFYDAGALWEPTREAKLRHSVGVAYRQGIFVLTMAFPVVEGHIAPVFMAGMNY
jgi:hypothetical protein